MHGANHISVGSSGKHGNEHILFFTNENGSYPECVMTGDSLTKNGGRGVKAGRGTRKFYNENKGRLQAGSAWVLLTETPRAGL